MVKLDGILNPFTLKIVRVNDEKNLNWEPLANLERQEKYLNVKSKCFWGCNNVKKSEKGK